jgi:hypothetical protein
VIGLRILSRGCASGTLSIALAAVLLRSNRIFAAYASRVKFLRAASRDKYTVRHYSLTALDPNFTHVMSWIHRRDVQYELHLARVRFWVPEGVILTEFLLQFADSCSLVDPSLDLATGLPLTEH